MQVEERKNLLTKEDEKTVYPFLTCFICCEYFIYPMTTECTHTICHECSHKVYKCPYCNKEISKWTFNVSISNAIEFLLPEHIKKYKKVIEELHVGYRLIPKYTIFIMNDKKIKTKYVRFLGKILTVIEKENIFYGVALTDIDPCIFAYVAEGNSNIRGNVKDGYIAMMICGKTRHYRLVCRDSFEEDKKLLKINE